MSRLFVKRQSASFQGTPRSALVPRVRHRLLLLVALLILLGPDLWSPDATSPSQSPSSPTTIASFGILRLRGLGLSSLLGSLLSTFRSGLGTLLGSLLDSLCTSPLAMAGGEFARSTPSVRSSTKLSGKGSHALLLPSWAPTAAVGWAEARLADQAWLTASWLLLFECLAGTKPLKPPFGSLVVAGAVAGSTASTSVVVVSGPD